ncbi:MAG: esterase-like activity of phytase family protein [Prevotellaceae bacterium]|jgi:hypothetical protein|nr:esterase-like activity of phytase family protein [Prevotellaceae bacterium]
MKKAIYFLCGTMLCGALLAQSGQKQNYSIAVVQSAVVTVPESATPVYIGGYGSSMACETTGGETVFYLLTDRGPNVEGKTSNSKVFPLPDFVPHIGKFRLENGVLVLMEKIELKEANGTPFSGLPSTEGTAAINETAYNLRGEIINTNGRRGIDPEGLTLAPDGSFWVSDEYAPYILHFDAKGFLLEELNPANGGLPPHYATRRPNRGMEGLTISRDGKTLTGIMQSPLYYPATKDNSLYVRIISIDLQSRRTSEYFYPLSSAKYAVSEICTMDNGDFLVLERDSDFPANGKGFKKIFRINLSQATDIAADNRPLETLSAEMLAENHIRPVQKELFWDILATIPSYPHDKPEGIALINKGGNFSAPTLCIINDDDFGINAPAAPDGTIVPKLAPDGTRDMNVMYFVEF